MSYAEKRTQIRPNKDVEPDLDPNWLKLMVFLKNFSKYLISVEKLPSMQRVKSSYCKVNLAYLWETEHFVCGTIMSHAKMSLHMSVIHCQVTFEWCSGHGSETSILWALLTTV